MSAAGAALALALGAAQPAEAAPPQPPPSPLQPGSPGAPPKSDDSAPAEPLADETKGTSVDQAYAAAELRQGALDGRWRLSDTAGVPLFDFQLSDPGERPSPRTSDTSRPEIEGAWRDLRRDGQPVRDGVLDQVSREAGRLVLSFHEPDAAHPVQVILHPVKGGWSGELAEVGATTVVFLERP